MGSSLHVSMVGIGLDIAQIIGRIVPSKFGAGLRGIMSESGRVPSSNRLAHQPAATIEHGGYAG